MSTGQAHTTTSRATQRFRWRHSKHNWRPSDRAGTHALGKPSTVSFHDTYRGLSLSSSFASDAGTRSSQLWRHPTQSWRPPTWTCRPATKSCGLRWQISGKGQIQACYQASLASLEARRPVVSASSSGGVRRAEDTSATPLATDRDTNSLQTCRKLLHLCR